MAHRGFKVIALNANLAQPEYNQLIFLKGKIAKRMCYVFWTQGLLTTS
jgi:hypothetical protein